MSTRTPTIFELLDAMDANAQRWAMLSEYPELASWAQGLSARVASMQEELARQIKRTEEVAV